MSPETIEALNELIQRSHATVKNSHAWTWGDHDVLQTTIKLVEQDMAQPARSEGWTPSRSRRSMRAHRSSR